MSRRQKQRSKGAGATAVPRVPYGMARRILETMAEGDACIVRPQWMVSFHNAARRLGMRVVAVAFRRDGRALYRVRRVGLKAPTGHALMTLPRRDRATGQWKKRRAA